MDAKKDSGAADTKDCVRCDTTSALVFAGNSFYTCRACAGKQPVAAAVTTKHRRNSSAAAQHAQPIVAMINTPAADTGTKKV